MGVDAGMQLLRAASTGSAVDGDGEGAAGASLHSPGTSALPSGSPLAALAAAASSGRFSARHLAGISRAGSTTTASPGHGSVLGSPAATPGHRSIAGSPLHDGEFYLDAEALMAQAADDIAAAAAASAYGHSHGHDVGRPRRASQHQSHAGAGGAGHVAGGAATAGHDHADAAAAAGAADGLAGPGHAGSSLEPDASERAGGGDGDDYADLLADEDDDPSGARAAAEARALQQFFDAQDTLEGAMRLHMFM
jgi:hypothetical protein